MNRDPKPRASSSASPKSRREVLRTAGGAAVGALFAGPLLSAPAAARQAQARAAAPTDKPAPLPPTAMAGGSDLLKIGLIGCGGRGRGAMVDCLSSSEGVEIHALGDVFSDQIAVARKVLDGSKDDRVQKGNKVADAGCFTGFDAYKKVIAADVDYVLVACPPYFHPYFGEAVVDAGKHAFVEKPGAIDGPGARALMRCSEKAAKQNTGFLAGTQRRHDLSYAAVVERIHGGAIGRVLYGEAVWNNTDWVKYPHKGGWSEMEWQLRSWRMNRWLSGDTPGVLAIHFLDSVNWALGETPDSAYGVGGKIARTSEVDGNIYDHHLAELRYKSGARVTGGSRISPGEDRHVDYVVGTEGNSMLGSGKIEGKSSYDYRRENGRPKSSYVLAHAALIQSVRDGRPINEAARLAEASLTAMMVRETGYTGKVVTWDFMSNDSQRRMGPDQSPDQLKFGPSPLEPVAVPGEYELI